MFYYHSLLFSMSEYYRLQSVEDKDAKYKPDMDIVHSNCLKRTQVPKREKEKLFIYKVVDISNGASEITNQADYDQVKDVFWDSLQYTKVKLRNMSSAEEAKLEYEEHCTVKEKFFSTVADSIGEISVNFNSDSTTKTTDKEPNSADLVVVNGVVADEEEIEEFSTIEDMDNKNNESTTANFLQLLIEERLDLQKRY